MKALIAALAFLALTSVPALASEGAVLGQPAPAFTATDSNGKTVSLEDYKGKIVVLEWTNDGCPFVQKHYGSGNMQATQAAATADGAIWLTVISSAPGKQGHVDGAGANKLTEEYGAVPTAVLLDETGTVGKLYDAKTTPHMFIIDKDGILVYRGAIDSNPSADKADIEGATNYVTAALADMKAGNPVATADTKSYGCGIKYGE